MSERSLSVGCATCGKAADCVFAGGDGDDDLHEAAGLFRATALVIACWIALCIGLAIGMNYRPSSVGAGTACTQK